MKEALLHTGEAECYSTRSPNYAPRVQSGLRSPHPAREDIWSEMRK